MAPNAENLPRVIDWTAPQPYLPLLKGPPETHGLRSGRVELGPGRDIGRHSTGDHEEVLVILEGAGQVLVEGHPPLEVRAGQEVYIPPQAGHNVRNTGAAALRYVYVVAPVRA